MNARLKIIDTNSSNTRKDFVIWAILALLLTVPGMTYGQMMAPEVMAVPELSVDHPSVRQVMSIQDRYTMELMAMSGVHAVGTGFSKEGTLAILVFASPEAPLSDLPEQLEGVPVERRAMGPVTPAITNDTELPVVGGNGALFKTWGLVNLPHSPFVPPILDNPRATGTSAAPVPLAHAYATATTIMSFPATMSSLA